ncbi:regulator of chromosome condensation 1/beta-lactamase-inhibitor protein II [Cryomyces antarcticus]
MLTHISEFSSFDDFVQWYDRPADSYPTAHYMLHGRAKQLIANETSFTLLTETGEVYTWGDARHRSLGRTPTAHMPAEKPGVVDALGGLKIGKIVSGGWMGAALAEGGSLYLWGTTTPGTADAINALPSGDEEVALVDIPASLGMHGEEADDFEVLDVGVGDGHIVAVGSFPTPPRPPHDPAGDNPSAYSFETSSETPSATALASPALHVSRTHIYAIGDGRNGQLGLGVPSYAENWKQAPVPWSWREHKAVGVACGPRTSFAFIRPTLNKKRKRTI